MEKEQQQVLMIMLIIFGGGVNIILSILEGISLSLKYEVVPPMLEMPVFLWGIGGYALLVILYFFLHKSKEKIMLVIPSFFTIAIVYGTSAAMGISFGAGLSCLFCGVVWIVNVFILIALIWEIIYVRVPVFFDQEEW